MRSLHLPRQGSIPRTLYEQPWKVIACRPEPVLEPAEDYDRGDAPNVVFTEGLVVVGEELLVFYVHLLEG